MTDWIVRRWARYGHERLYAETPGGTALGYLDLKTGRYHSDDLNNLPLLEKAIGDHLAGTAQTQAESAAVVEKPEPVVAPVAEPVRRLGRISAAIRPAAPFASRRSPRVRRRGRPGTSLHESLP